VQTVCWTSPLFKLFLLIHLFLLCPHIFQGSCDTFFFSCVSVVFDLFLPSGLVNSQPSTPWTSVCPISLANRPLGSPVGFVFCFLFDDLDAAKSSILANHFSYIRSLFPAMHELKWFFMFDLRFVQSTCMCNLVKVFHMRDTKNVLKQNMRVENKKLPCLALLCHSDVLTQFVLDNHITYYHIYE
jgi:hypothetical protein